MKTINSTITDDIPEYDLFMLIDYLKDKEYNFSICEKLILQTRYATITRPAGSSLYKYRFSIYDFEIKSEITFSDNLKLLETLCVNMNIDDRLYIKQIRDYCEL